MKKTLLVLLLYCALATNCLAQYFPLFKDNAVWLQQEELSGGAVGCRKTTISYTDITIGSVTYKNCEELDEDKIAIAGPYYLREDCVTKKVYVYDQVNHVERLCYDFSLSSVGQSVTVYPISPIPVPAFATTLTVVSISINPNNSQRTITLSGYSPFFNANVTAVWLEGVGSLMGLIYNTDTYFSTSMPDRKLLLCHSKNNQPDYAAPQACVSFSCPNPQDPIAENCSSSPCSTPLSISINPSLPVVCSGSDITLTASGATTYNWSTTPVQTTPSITVSPVTTTTYTVTGTDGNNCSGSATITVNVHPNPSISVNSATINCGQSAILTANGGTSYSWNVIPVQTTGSITVSPTTTTNYVVTGTDNNNCSSTATSTVTVSGTCPCINPPGVTFGTVGNICGLNPITFTGNTIDNSATIANITTNGQGTLSITSSTISPFNFTYTPVAADFGNTVTIQLISNNPNGGSCQPDIENVGLLISAPILPTFSQLGLYCVGATAGTLPTTSNNGITGTWSPSTVSTSTAGTSTYTFTPSAGQCASTATMDISVSTSLTPTFSQLGPYCVGATAGTLPTTSNNGITGTWSPSTVSTSTAGTSTYTFTPSAVQCATTATMNVTINAKPNLTLNCPSSSICAGQQAGLLASSTTTPVTYSWSNGLGSAASINPAPNATTTYTVTATSNGCTSSASCTVTINPNCGSCCALLCPWEKRGNDAINAAPRGQIILNATCSDNNFIGTRGGNATQTNDLVFGANNNGWMRLTTNGGLFLTDNATTPNWGNIRIGMFAGINRNNGCTRNVIIGHNAAVNTFNAEQVIIGNNAGAGLGNAVTDQGWNGGRNVMIGSEAGNNRSVSQSNVFIGWHSSGEVTTTLASGQNQYNTFIGSQSGAVNTASENTFIGTQTGFSNTTGASNTFVGKNSGHNINTGSKNTFIGANSGNNVTVGNNNIYLGLPDALYNTPDDITCATCNNVVLGNNAGAFISTGSHNTILGTTAGWQISTGRYNTFLGLGAGNSVTAGSNNVYIGNNAGNGNPGSTGNNNVAIGNGTGANPSGSVKNCYVAIGNSTNINGDTAISIAPNYSTENPYNSGVGQSSISMGVPSTSAYLGKADNYSVSIGYESSAAANSVSIGTKSYSRGTSGIAIGNNAHCGVSPNGTGTDNIAIGTNSLANGNPSGAIALGTQSSAKTPGSIAIGLNSKVDGSYSKNSTAIGYNASINGYQNSIVIGSPNSVSDPTQNPLVGISTIQPTTRFHVDCRNNNISYNFPITPPSAIRFEGLQTATTCTGMNDLAIDANGYVYRKLSTCPAAREANPALDTKTDSLQKAVADQQKQIDELKAIIAEMSKDVDKCCTKTSGNAVEDFPMSKNITLYQNVPNPFTIGTDIKFFIPETVKQAALVIYDLNGREIRKIDINERNESVIKIQGKELAAGMYIYTLIADNKEVDSKRMILTGN
ncbi:MAG: T9SS type A sorting domain-containing protein [Chitinophagales bacterium]|nr:T9SS type A sorting domain-containing protein [Chitinophagales bacterium]